MSVADTALNAPAPSPNLLSWTSVLKTERPSPQTLNEEVPRRFAASPSPRQ
jgi:hypothetical protein